MSGADSSSLDPRLERLRQDLSRHEPEGSPRYEILQPLGEGSTSVVYHARDRELNRRVALKLLKEPPAGSPVRERFRREAEAAAGISHPNVVQVFDAGEREGRPFIVMEFVEGRTLSAVLRDEGSSLRDRVALLEQAARGAAAAHARGVVHRDLKPANILVSSAGVPKIADFGLVHVEASATGLTRTGTALGTPLYMAPEQVEGATSLLSSRSDVYSLGAILYEMLSGHPPFVGETVMDVYRRIVSEEAARVPTAPPDLESIALRALEKHPSRRYPDAGAFADDLGRWLRGEPVEARPPSRLRRFVRRVARRAAWPAAALLCIACGAGAALWMSRPDPRDVRLLFNGSDLAGWVPARGRWEAAEGLLRVSDLEGGAARIHTFDAFRDYDLELKVRAEGQRAFVELQVHDGSRFIPVSLGREIWHEVRVRVRGTEAEAWLGESRLEVDAQPGRENVREGPFGIWTRGRISLKDLRLVRPRAEVTRP